MLKRDEAADPRSCWNKAAEDEYVFVILGRDGAAPATIRAWVETRVRLGKNSYADPQIREALAWAEKVEAGLPRPRTGVSP